MRLLLDIGNTRIKWAVQTAQGLSEQQAISHAALSTAQLGTQVFAPCGQVDAVRVSNVAGEAMAEQIRQAARDCWQLEPQFVTATAQATVKGHVIRNAYPHPQQLGTDRWLALLAAYALSPAAALVVSVGTAMTLDAINAAGQHLGGLIVPGPNLMTRSLLRHTSDIAERAAQTAPPESGASFFADNTRDCVQTGSLRAAGSLIEAAYQHLRHSSEPQLVLTGGGAPRVQAQLSISSQLIPDLVLQGLAQS
jgi:type III pantothenate kinase